MSKTYLKYPIFLTATGLSIITPIHAGTPVWTFSAPSLASLMVSAGETATVQYTVTNQSSKPKNLILDPKTTPSGLSASSCQLAAQGQPGSTCTLTLTVDGGAISSKGIHKGPVLCEQGNANQCYRPSKGNELQIAFAYTGIYAETNNELATYSPNNGINWGYMLSPQAGWFGNYNTRATAVTSDGTMYQATGVQGNSVTGNGAATLIYSSDGITWTQVASFPTNNDYVQSLFAVGNTVYVGTGNGYVYSTSDLGTTWIPSTPAKVPDASTVNAIVVDGSGNYYAGTNNGNVYYSMNSGEFWTALTNQPAGGGSISSLAIDATGTLYAVTSSTTRQPQYNSAPLTGTWQTMGALPASDENATTIAASGNLVYVGTSNSHIAYTSNKGTSWSANQLPNDTSGIFSLTVSKTTSLSPLFVESYGTIQLTGGANTSTITLTNFTNTTANHVRAISNQLPAGVTSSSCDSVVSGGSCTITLTAEDSTSPFAPTAFDIIDDSNRVIARSALVSSVTPDGGSNYYYVYNVIGATAYVLDNTNASSGIPWSSNSTNTGVDYTSIWGIAENSTTTIPYPNATQPAGQTATQYDLSNCNGATDGLCNAKNIVNYYTNHTSPPVNASYYAAGLCSISTNGAASQGDWYLPSACELNGGIYLNVTTNNFSSCAPVLTGISSLNALAALGGNLQTLLSAGYYWSSTEHSGGPQFVAWGEYFSTGGSGQGGVNKGGTLGVRCSRALTL